MRMKKTKKKKHLRFSDGYFFFRMTLSESVAKAVLRLLGCKRRLKLKLKKSSFG